jgi:hypothetical protein
MLSLSAFGIYDLLVFVLVFSLVYAILSKSKFFDKSDIPALIAVSIALISLVSTFFVAFVVTYLPYVLAILVFIFLMLLLFSTAEMPAASIGDYMRKSTLVPVILVFMLFIFGLIAFSSVASQFPISGTSSNSCGISCPSSGGSTGSNSSAPSGPITRTSLNGLTSQYIISLFTNPQVLSLLLTLMAMAIAVYFMTRERGA